MYVFRENHRLALAGRLLNELAEAMRRADSSSEPEHMQDALLRAGELECSLADAGQQVAASQVAGVTDCLASALVRGDRLAVSQWCLQILKSVGISGELSVKIPEGFAYYALHPLDYARVVDEKLNNISGAAILGIRTIGTTLSAVVAAELRRHRIAASRVTVRPHGHPFRRECRFSTEQREWIAERKRSSDMFLIVDEGPGLSGSSFLSVANALQIEGVEPEKIIFLCSRVPEIASFCSETSRAEWPRFRAIAAASSFLQFEDHRDVSWGGLRKQVFSEQSAWPAAWTHMERRKFLSHNRASFLKFEGQGKYGEAAFERANKLGEAGFGPRVWGREDGFTRYEWLEGEPMRSDQLDETLVERMAQYCAFRANEFQANDRSRDAVSIETMTRVNLREEFGSDEVDLDLTVLVGGPKVITDSRMMPHAWVRNSDGRILKTDGSLHGDDHFFPGPCDIAWDLAGAIVEWEMGDCVAKHFLAKYFEITGDDARPRIQAFVTAYAAFRMGYCKMAAAAMPDSDEELRLKRDYAKYRDALAARSRQPELARAA
ncbi:MAG: hypothetical protein ACJ71N_07755 [Terriglobales bacterium]